MSLGRAPSHADIFRSSTAFCDEELAATSIYKLLHRECHRLFPDDAFVDLFDTVGRDCVPPRIVAVVMVLQKLEGLSDRDAVDRFRFDLRWKYAAGGLDLDYPGFVHTVLVGMRARLRRSKRPNRIFEAVLDVAKAAGLVGRRRVLDSTALYDAVATQDTVTMIRSSIRGLLRVADAGLAAEVRGVLRRDDTYETPGKPACDWEDEKAREALVDALARDAHAVVLLLDERELAPEVMQAAALIATVVGQDLEPGADGLFRIARRVAADRVISTVDPEARHGHKTAARGFDGYKGHVAIDPDSEIVVSTTVTPGNASDGSVAEQLLQETLASSVPSDAAIAASADPAEPTQTADVSTVSAPVEVYGDASYGTAEIVEHIEAAGAEANVKVQAPTSPNGTFTKDAFEIDLTASTVRCPQGVLVPIRLRKDGAGLAVFGASCVGCPQRERCTQAKKGRVIGIHPQEATLARSRKRQRDPAWKQRYRATRPKVERKIAHLMRHRHGGRRARMRGRIRVAEDFAMLGAAVNLRRLAQLDVRSDGARWSRPTTPTARP